MSIRHLGPSLALLLLAATTAFPQSPLEFVPPDAVAAIVVRNPEDLRKKGDKLIEESKIDPRFRPSSLAPLAYLVMGINKESVDETKPLAVVVVNPEAVKRRVEDLHLETLVVAFAVKDVEKMAGHFDLKKDDLKPGLVVEAKRNPTWFGGGGGNSAYCMLKGEHYYVGFHKEAVRQVSSRKGLSAELSETQRRLIGEADGFLHLGTRAWGDLWKRFLRDAGQTFDVAEDETEKKVAGEFIEALGAVRFGVVAIRVDRGLGFSFLSVFSKENGDAVRKFLTAFRGGEGASTVAGLPEGDVVAVQAATGDGSKNAAIARVFFRVAVQRLLEPQRFFGTSDRAALMNVFGEVWQRLQGSRLALYRNANPNERGLFSLVGILETEDPKQFLTDLQQLARLGGSDGLDLKSEEGKKASEAEIEQLVKDLGARRFNVRESAERKLELAGEAVLPYLDKAIRSDDVDLSRRAERVKREIVKAAEARRKELLSGELTRSIKPSFGFLDKTEMVEQTAVRLIAVKLSRRDAATAPQLGKLFGPDWNRVRIAVVGKQVVVLVGSDTALLSSAIRNLKDAKPGLAGSKLLADQVKRTDPKRKLEMHFSSQLAYALATAEDLEKPAKLPVGLPVSTVTLSVEPDRVHADVWMPAAEVKVLLKAMGW